MRRLAPIAFLALLLPAISCQTTAKPSGSLDRGLRGAQMTTIQLDVHMADFVLYFVDSVERAADRITAGAHGDLSIQEHALRWKIYTVPAVFSAAFHDDPLASYLDLRIFTIQMHRFFATGAGSRLFGEHQRIAIGACEDLERRITVLGASISNDPEIQEEGRELTERLAEEQPLEDLFFLREPLDPKSIKDYVVEARAVVDVAHDINRNIAAIRRLVAAEFAILPRQAGWQAQLTTLQMLRSSGIDPGEARAQAAQLTKNFTTLANTVDSMPDLVSSERAKILEEAKALQARTIKQLEAMLLQTQGWTQDQRCIVLEQLSRERKAILDAVDRQRTAAVQDLQASADRATLRLHKTADQLIDRVFRKILILWLIILVTTILGVLLIRRLSPRP